MNNYTSRILWNTRSRYIGLIIEQALVFIVLLFSMIQTIERLHLTLIPGKLNVEDVIIVSYSTVGKDRNNGAQFSTVVNNLKSLPYVATVSETINFCPYINSETPGQIDSVHVDGNIVAAYIKGVDAAAYDLFEPNLLSGSWITQDYMPDGSIPAIVTPQLSEKLGWRDPIGKKIIKTSKISTPITIVGYMDGYRQSLTSESSAALIVPNQFVKGYKSTAVRSTPGDLNMLSATFYNEFNRLMSNNNAYPMIYDVGGLKEENRSGHSLDLMMALAPTIFLLLFACLGTVGLFWLNSKKRILEFSIRLSLGLTRQGLYRSVIYESILITTIALIPGIIIAFFIPKPFLVILSTLLMTFIVMYLFSILSAWYPAFKISKINPAQALHYE